MKNITVTLDDELYRAAEAAAARQQTSVAAVVRSYLAAFATGRAPGPLNSPENEDQKDREEVVRLSGRRI